MDLDLDIYRGHSAIRDGRDLRRGRVRQCITKNNQAPEGVQSTATYSVTTDSNNDWQITDVGGIGAMMDGE